jgi:hypothetical protein
MKGLLIFPCFLLSTLTAFACTIFSGIDPQGHTLVANTEDHRPNLNIYFKVRVASASTYGFFGTVYSHPDGWLQGGSNDQGLFFDTNELGNVPVRQSAGKKEYNFPVDPGSYVLQHCKNVDEVIDFFNTYRIELPAQVHLADKSGNLAIILNDTIIRTPGKFQLTTNFHPLRHDIGVYPCWRYSAVSKHITQKGVHKSSFREAMFASAQHGNTMTIYSNLGDLTSGDWTYYAFGYQGSEYRFNIHDLLKKGDRTVLLRQLFSEHPYLKYYDLATAKNNKEAVSAFKKDRVKYSIRERLEIPKVMIWNNLFWDTNYQAAMQWLDLWWAAVTEASSEDWMTKATVELLNNRPFEALGSLKETLALDPSSETAKHYMAHLKNQYNSSGHLKLRLPGYRNAGVVTVGGISSNPNYYLMHPEGDGWEITMNAGGTVNYYFLVDGKKIFDALNPVKQVIPTITGPVEMNIKKID